MGRGTATKIAVEGFTAVSATDKAYKTARKFRRELSLPEKLLWVRIRRNELNFRRQHPIGEYVLDFYCPAAKLAIEVDGAAHDFGDRPDRDNRRAAWLKGEGIEVVRIPAKDVLRDPDEVANAIVGMCKPLHRPALPDGPPPHELRSQGGANR
jgi:very-short-patch-repair endonuclease